MIVLCLIGDADVELSSRLSADMSPTLTVGLQLPLYQGQIPRDQFFCNCPVANVTRK